MSREIHVFFRGKVPTKAALAWALRELGFSFTIPDAKGSLAKQSGYMPMKLRGEETGVEFDLYRDRAAIEEFAAHGVDPSYEHRASFRWSGDLQEAAGGLCGAAALAKLTGGAVFDETEGRILSLPDAIAAAKELFETLPKPDPRQPGTRPTDIKRYLKPLLELRSDLVVRGRLLLVRPFRHVLRGALLDKTGDKYRFNTWRYLTPLYSATSATVGFGEDRRSVDSPVWQPYFKDALLDSLAEDIFDHVGPVISLTDFADRLKDTRSMVRYSWAFHYARVIAPVLGGRPELASQYVTELERKPDATPQDYVQLRSFLQRDIGSICAEYHEKEAAAAKEMKLDDIWEPSPFPVELPESERASRSDERPFVTAPWVARPPNLVEVAPEHPGEVRFARIAHRRKGRIVLIAPLTRAEAEEKHRNREEYVLVTRLPQGQTLVLDHKTGWSPHDPDQPKNPDYVPKRDFWLWVHGSSGRVLAQSWERHRDKTEHVEMWSVGILRSDSISLWQAHNDFRKRYKGIHDDRTNPGDYEEREMTSADILLCCRYPAMSIQDANIWQFLGAVGTSEQILRKRRLRRIAAVTVTAGWA